jgi:hypothetical protein
VAVLNTDINGQTVKCSWGKESGDPNNAQAAGQVSEQVNVIICLLPYKINHSQLSKVTGNERKGFLGCRLWPRANLWLPVPFVQLRKLSYIFLLLSDHLVAKHRELLTYTSPCLASVCPTTPLT